ncbi:molybdopterin-dependent oxidoreductase [Actinomadura sp. LD22]|uniref:Molybdopterin-dependent oxidoreductase n=1 Tax=Actinomadura physcomitrii TaxID=2650748 RepID=A0A6I4MA88_9ACTN|nr:sulfite oxidase [Actinomadura physcomitrii]MWA01305.1 molybdopterin-dependent oxidoreductase [Actinomadura physcomitrii]
MRTGDIPHCPQPGHDGDLTDEATYQRVRAAQAAPSGHALSRRGMLRVSAGAGFGAALGAAAASPRPALAGTAPATGIVKPLPPDLFIPHGTNAEMRWEAMRGQGLLTPADRFFVRNHIATPRIDARTWRLKLWGTGLHGAPPESRPVEFSYEDLLGMRAETITSFIECTGNARGFYASQQGQEVSGTPWRLGAVGVARWRGVPLSAVLERAGLTPQAVDILPRGLDADFVDEGENLGRVRRPLPVAKALKDVLLAYEMNGAPLPPDHGFPVRLVVPSWVGVANIKWLGDIQVADEPLHSPWNTRYYRLFGPGYPPEGSAPLTRMNVKSAFELPWDASLPAHTQVLHGRSWSGTGRVTKVEVSADGGRTWRRARVHDRHTAAHGWVRWEFPWRPDGRGRHELLARATDDTGASQPSTAPYNTLGYLFGAVVRHPVTVL